MKTKTTLSRITEAYFIEAGFGHFLDADLVWSAETLRKIADRCDAALRERRGQCPNSSWGCRDPHCVEHRGAKAVPFDAPDPRD